MTVCLVFTTLPDAAAADALALQLVNKRLAACVTRLAAAQSVYRWQGQVASATEVPLLIKTTTERYAALEAAVRAAHPYDVPELVAIPVTAGLPEYLHWVAEEAQAC